VRPRARPRVSREPAAQGVGGSSQAARRDFPPTVVVREHLLAQVAFEATWEREFATDRVSWSGGFASMFGYAPDEMGDP
jgi:hypothetical protein